MTTRGSRGTSAATVVVQTGSNDLDNLGDLAMLEVLIERMRAMHKGVSFSVFARQAAKVESLGNDVRQIEVEQKSEWAIARSAYLGARRVAPSIDSALRSRLPSVYTSLLRSKARSLANGEAVRRGTMLVVSGGGFLTDVFPGQAWPVFERLRVAVESGIPVALMGQGIGPLRDKQLVEAARSTLPRAEMIAVRESLYSVPLLLELGVDRDRIFVTGDDAIEPAYRARSDLMGSNIGVNLRIANYAGTTSADAATLRTTLSGFAATHSAKLIPLPVCVADSPDTKSDSAVIESVLNEADASTDRAVPTTDRLISRFGNCRVVVTGSYHGAVFALSQGIPAVCLFKSEYYEMKFRGLRAQVGEGCELIDMNADRFEVAIEKVAGNLWDEAAALRPSLLIAARHQVDEGHHAYDRLSQILGSVT